ncbi:hypothetical protein B0O99DRAFT_700782, partial [Bisporella sp. PMI_857]
DPLSIWVGWGGVIPRWKKGQVVQFAVLPGSFPTPYHAAFAAYKLNEAAIQWNSLNIGVTFKWVSKLEDAAFVLAYGGDGGTILLRHSFQILTTSTLCLCTRGPLTLVLALTRPTSSYMS